MSSTAALEAAYRDFDEASGVLLPDDRVPRYVAWRISALADDVRSATEMLLGSYGEGRAAIGATRELLATAVKGTGDQVFDRTEGPLRRAATAFKLMYIFIRAYQDALCGALNELTGKKAGKYSSMSKPLKDDASAVRLLVDQHIPKYFSWFRAWKEERDRMKTGARFMVSFDAQDDFVLIYTYPVGDGAMGATQESAISLAAIAEGLRMSARLRDLVADRAGATHRVKRP